MSVIVLTDICNLSCEYCFYSSILVKKRDELIAKGLLKKETIFFDTEEAKKIANRLDDSQTTIDLKKKSIVITGWEPTLHPDFIEIMTYFIRKWFSIHLLTNFAFPSQWKVYKFLQKNKDNFRFLVNFNEIEKQKLSTLTFKNIIDFDYEHLKIGLNLYHDDYNFDDVIDILKQTKNIKTLRIGLPNAQADEWINQWAKIWMIKKGLLNEEQDMKLYTEDLFEQDLESIKETWNWLRYGLLDPKVYEYYHDYLWGALRELIDKLEKNWFGDRINFYIDCWFDYKVLPADVVGYMIQRLYYKNPCSIPNWVCVQVPWTAQQCYSIWNYGNFADVELSYKNYSINDINKFYILSAQLLQNCLLNQVDELNFEMCRGNNLRFFKQLFTKWTFNKWKFVLKDYNISNKGDKDKGYELKDVDYLSKRYIQEYKATKKTTLLFRLFQLFEFCLAHWFLDEARVVLDNSSILILTKKDELWLTLRLHLYEILLKFVSESTRLTKDNQIKKIQPLRDESCKNMEEVAVNIKNEYWELLPNHLLVLFDTVKLVVNKWAYPKNLG